MRRGVNRGVNEGVHRFDLIHLHLEEAVAEGAGQHLAAAVRAGRVLRREEHEVRVRPDCLGGVGDVELAVVVEEAVERLEHLWREGVNR